MLKRDFHLFFLALFSMLFLSSCGKVIQQVGKDDVPKSFDMSFSVGPVQQELYGDSQHTHSSWDVSDDEVYVQVRGVEASGVSELSWGRAVLLPVIVEGSPEDVSITVSENARDVTLNTVLSEVVVSQDIPIVYESVAYRKDGLRLTGGANHKWTKIEYDQKNKTWSISSRKIKLGYPYYQVVFYTTGDHFMMKTVDAEFVSGNPSVKLGSLDDYDLFVSILSNLILKERPDYFERSDMLDVLVSVFPLSFFRELSYVVPQNIEKSFTVKRPAFVLEGLLEKELVKWFFLFDDDIKAAKDYLESYEGEWFTEDLRESYNAVIESLESVKATNTEE